MSKKSLVGYSTSNLKTLQGGAPVLPVLKKNKFLSLF